MDDQPDAKSPNSGLAAMDARREQAARSGASAHPEAYSGDSPIRVNKLGHLVYEVSDIERSVRFWTEVMGFEETERNEFAMVFLRCRADHHTIGLKQADAKRRPGDGLKFHHLAMEVDSVDVLLKARDYLKRNDIPIMFEGRFGSGSNVAINFLDPDGFEFELYCGMDQIDESGRVRPKSAQRRARSLEEAIASPPRQDW